MRWAKKMRDIPHRCECEIGKSPWFHGQEGAVSEGYRVDSIGAQQPVLGCVLAKGQHVSIEEFSHPISLDPKRLNNQRSWADGMWTLSPASQQRWDQVKSTDEYRESLRIRCSLLISRIVPLLLRITIE